MNQIKVLHQQAMEQTDRAIAARLQGEETIARSHFENAFVLESKAANLLLNDLTAEPTRSVLFKSAASLAMDCKRMADAEKLICTALIGHPPEQIAEELRDLLEQVNFHRHLELRGVTLHGNEMQMSIAGKGISYGLAPTDAFIGRVEKTETLIYRIAERKRSRPYQDKGRRSSNLELYLSVPRAASFAVTFQVGKRDQLSLPGASQEENIIDELIDCLDIFMRGDESELRHRIHDDAYYRNFVALAKTIAPDGKEVNMVGFTALRRGVVKKVALTSMSESAAKSLALGLKGPQHFEDPASGPVEIVGTLKFADSRKAGKDIIQLIDTQGLKHSITVPRGMMSDIVKPLWEEVVVVTATQKGKTILLEDIRPSKGEAK